MPIERVNQRTQTGADAEGALIDAAIAGDAEAFAALYDQHLTRVYRHIYYWVRNQADAEDLSQQVFLQAWRALAHYRRTNVPFIVWLLTIARNLMINFFRRAKRARELDLTQSLDERWSDPEEDALARSDQLAVRRAILQLKPDQQQVIVLRFLEHFDYATIAAALGKSEGNVRVIQHRALAELRRLLSSEVNV